MELTIKDGKYLNKKKDLFEIEDILVYPLIKSSGLKKPIINNSSKYVLVTQKKIKEDTNYIQDLAPLTWNYLNKNKEFFDKRKSVIYKNAPDFSIFGIGDYSFSKYKVAISGFYKKPLFCLLNSEKPMMLDDTCYFIPFYDYDMAYISMLLLNSGFVQDFLKDIVFLDSKRPYTKKILKRIDLKECLNHMSFEDLIISESNLNLSNYIDETKFIKYKSNLLEYNNQKTLI